MKKAHVAIGVTTEPVQEVGSWTGLSLFSLFLSDEKKTPKNNTS
jgi:hypothetical protein